MLRFSLPLKLLVIYVFVNNRLLIFQDVISVFTQRAEDYVCIQRNVLLIPLLL